LKLQTKLQIAIYEAAKATQCSVPRKQLLQTRFLQNVSCSLATPHYRDICHLTSALNISGIVVQFVSSINQTSFTVNLESARKLWKKDGKKAELSSPAGGGDALPDS
jgi:hypothetical protein